MSPRGKRGPARIVVLDKPSGPTSFDLVRRVRRVTGYAKVGHAGTLDPMASGVLVLGIGAATRLLGYLSGGEKTYRGLVRFTGSTDTDDATGKVLRTGCATFTREKLETAVRSFTGEIEQRPPVVSALKVDGKRAYALYRDKGETPELKPRRVIIHSIEIISWEKDELDLRVRCGGGTYIRALARDLGEALGCPAHLAALCRERVGPFDLSVAVSPEAFESSYERGEEAGLFSPASAVRSWPRVVLESRQVEAVRHGVQPEREWADGVVSALSSSLSKVALVDASGGLVGLADFAGPAPCLLMILPEDGDESR